MSAKFLSAEIQEKWAPLMLGNRLFLDVANSAYEGGGVLPDPLEDLERALTYMMMSGIFGQEHAQRIYLSASATGKASLMADMRKLRQQAIAIADTVIFGNSMSVSVIKSLNKHLQTLDGGMRLATANNQLSIKETLSEPTPRQILGLVSKSVAEFLVNDDYRRLKKCANDDCPLYFYDTSKNGRRRWCRMDVCGNRSKAHTHYHRGKG